jgi:hypothetical protein
MWADHTSSALNPALGPGADARGLLTRERRTNCLVPQPGVATRRQYALSWTNPGDYLPRGEAQSVR